MKKFLVVLLACAMIFGFASTAMAADTQIPEFSDIADQPQAVKTAMQKLAVLGVLVGNDGLGGPIRPADNLTRAEFAKIVAFLTNSTKVADAMGGVATRFTDVPAGMWYTGYVNAAAQSGYYLGDPEGTFRPNDNITMQEVVTVALRCAGYTDMLPGTWPANYVNKATNVGILDDVTLVGSAPASRADMALICNAVLDIHMVVHINNEIAFAQGLSAGTVDADGFAEVYYMSNEDSTRTYETILLKAFKCINPRGVFEFAKKDRYDEVSAWNYVSFADGELQFNFSGDTAPERAYVDGSFEVAEKYYINKDYTLPMLAGVQADVVINDDDEVIFVNIRGNVETGSAYTDSAGRVIVGSKTYQLSNVMFDKPAKYANLNTSTLPDNADDAVPAKVYIDKDGKVYAVRTYGDYNTVGFGLFKEIDENEVAYVESNFAAGTPKFDTSKNYALIKDNELIKAEDLERLDVLYYLGEIAGVKSWLALGSQEGEMTSQNRTSGKLTIDDTTYRGASSFMYSDDGGDSFDVFDLTAHDIDTSSFAEAIYGKSYNWTRLAFAAANAINTKVIGIVTAIDPGQTNISGSATFAAQYKEITIFNAEGKSQTIPFHKDFRNAYNALMNGAGTGAGGATDVSGYGTGNRNYYTGTGASGVAPAVADNDSLQAKWDAVIANNNGEDITAIGEIKEGDIIQLVLDKDGNAKSIANFAEYDGAGGPVDITVKAATERIVIEGGGTFTLPSSAIVLCATKDSSNDFDKAKLVSVASVLSGSFKAAKAVAFDVKSSGAINVLYYIGDESTVFFGVVSGDGTDSTGDFYTINGAKVYNDGATASEIDNVLGGDGPPALVGYNIKGGDAVIDDANLLLVWNDGTGIGFNGGLANVNDSMDGGAFGDYVALRGVVDNYNTGTKAVKIGNTYMYVGADTYIYDLFADDDATTSDLRGAEVVAVFNAEDENVLAAIVIVSDIGTPAAAADLVMAADIADQFEDAMFAPSAGDTVNAFNTPVVIADADLFTITNQGWATGVSSGDFAGVTANYIVMLSAPKDMAFDTTAHIEAELTTLLTKATTVTVTGNGSKITITITYTL